MEIAIVAACAAVMLLVEKLYPASELPKVKNWWARVALVNLTQAGLVIVAGLTWDRWFHGASLLRIGERLPWAGEVAVGYIVVTFIYYFWHRVRHESRLFWRLCHQLHHSPQRMEVLMSFYKHPFEITLNSMISSVIAFPLLGCSPKAAATITVITGVAEFFYHWNVRTPRWFGFLFQRPESHRVHHQRDRHTHNYGDLPIWDMLFGTFENPTHSPERCGFDSEREDRFEDMLAFRDVYAPGVMQAAPLKFLPTCIGCSKRWGCAAASSGESAKTNQDIEV